MHSNKYTFLYAFAFTSLVAIVLAVVATGLKPMQDMNAAQAKRRAILQSVMDVNDATLEADYNQYITEVVVDTDGNEVTGVQAFDLDVRKERRKDPSERQLPIFVYENGSQKNFIIPMEGNGLWGPIRAYMALEEDLNTVSGVVFDHDKETPGLGAEITAAYFQEQFEGKQLYDDQGSFQAIRVLKGRGNDIEGKPHQVDGMSGATMTANGVTDMIRNELENYTTYFEKLRG